MAWAGTRPQPSLACGSPRALPWPGDQAPRPWSHRSQSASCPVQRAALCDLSKPFEPSPPDSSCRLQPRVARLALKGENRKGALVDATQRLVADESLQTFDPQGELASSEAALAGEVSRAQALEVLGQGVFRAVDDPQILGAAALDGGLDGPAGLSTRREVEGLDDHALSPTPGQFEPPGNAGGDGLRTSHVNHAIRRCEKQSIVLLADPGQRVHVPDVIAVAVDVAFGGQQVERCELQVGERSDRPCVPLVGIDVEAGHLLPSGHMCGKSPPPG